LEVFLFDNQNASRVNQVNGSRPEFVWENWEDLFYAYVWRPTLWFKLRQSSALSWSQLGCSIAP
jgi:hypothetical protein